MGMCCCAAVCYAVQMVVACRVLAAEPGEDKAAVTNVVFMGMGGKHLYCSWVWIQALVVFMGMGGTHMPVCTAMLSASILRHMAFCSSPVATTARSCTDDDTLLCCAHFAEGVLR